VAIPRRHRGSPPVAAGARPGELPVDAEGQGGGAEDELRRLRQIPEPEISEPIPVASFEMPNERIGPDPVPERMNQDRYGPEIPAAERSEGIGDLTLPVGESLAERTAELVEPGGEKSGKDAPARDRTDCGYTLEDPKLVQPTERAQVEQGGSEAASGKAKGNAFLTPRLHEGIGGKGRGL
jgi:hypothetical protein